MLGRHVLFVAVAVLPVLAGCVSTQDRIASGNSLIVETEREMKEALALVSDKDVQICKDKIKGMLTVASTKLDSTLRPSLPHSCIAQGRSLPVKWRTDTAKYVAFASETEPGLLLGERNFHCVFKVEAGAVTLTTYGGAMKSGMLGECANIYSKLLNDTLGRNRI